MEYKKILIGLNCDFSDWLSCLKKINKPNIFLCDFETQLLSYIDKNEIDYYILPLSKKDYNVANNLLKNNKNITFLYPSSENIMILNNKLLFTKYMIENFINLIPKVYYLDNVKLQDEINFPLISKPIFSTNGNNMSIINDNKQLVKCDNKIIIQKYIEYEYEYGAFFLCIDGKIINHKIIKKSYPPNYIKKNNFKNFIKVLDFPIDLIETITLKLNYTGGGNIDFKYDEETKQIFIFEFNPRFGGSAFTNNFIYELLCIKK